MSIIFADFNVRDGKTYDQWIKRAAEVHGKKGIDEKSSIELSWVVEGQRRESLNTAGAVCSTQSWVRMLWSSQSRSCTWH
jgi:hypothetical protein